MTSNNQFTNLSASRMIASIFGVLAGLGGLTHGIGESLQGNMASEGIMVNFWAQCPTAPK